jgi:cell division protein FtsI/penicillin-binding protein 2
LVAGLVVALLVARVVDVQALAPTKYAAYGNAELFHSVTLPALRGAVYDRNGNLLAVSVPRVDVVSDNFQVQNPDTDLGALSRLLHVPGGALRGLLARRAGFIVLARQVSPATETAVEALGLPNIAFVPDPLRVYPDTGLFSAILGGVGWVGKVGGVGNSGLEYLEQNLLSGKPGSEAVAIGPAGEALPDAARDIVPSKQGEGLVLTLDESLQFEVTKALSAQVAATHAHDGIAIVMDTKTGGILAMVNLQRGLHGQVVPADSNLALTTYYQAGSVMKLATISGALQQHLITPNETFTVPDQVNVGGSEFQDADYHPTEQLSVSQILAQSSNVGTIGIAARLGPTLLYHYLRDLGYGQYTSLNWPAETPGALPKPGTSDWWGSSMGTIPIGTGEAVTAMQVLDAYNAVANGGVFIPPRLVQATVSANGTEHVLPYARTHRVLDTSTVQELLPMLELVTAAGTATAAQVPGYTVAGKTGTAQIPLDGGYEAGGWMATFVGFVPAQAPQLTAIVVLNHPDEYYGGVESAPVFSTIMRYALPHFGISPPSATPGQP